MAILRVTFGGPRKRTHEGSKPDQQHSNKLLFQQLQSHFNQRQEFHVYTLLSRQQVLELREVRGGDEMRLNYLTENLGVKLVGRKGLGPTADSVIASIKAERGNRKSASTPMTLKSGTSKPKLATIKQKLIRKAKVIRNNNGPTPLDLGGGVKIVGNDTSSLPPTSQNVRVKTVGNGNGPTTTHSPSLNVVPKAAGESTSSTTFANVQVAGVHASLPPPSSTALSDEMSGEMQEQL